MSSGREGFALLGVLWVAAVMAVIGASAMVTARTAVTASQNRSEIARAFWAREACVEMLAARGPGRGDFGDGDTLRFERDVWCAVSIERLDHRVNLNRASRAALLGLLPEDSLVDALMDWRDADDIARPRGAESAYYRSRRRIPPRNGPLASVSELAFVRGFDAETLRRVAPLATTEGRGFIDVNSAPAAVIRTLPLEAAAIDAVIQRRARRAFGSTAELGDYLESLASGVAAEDFEALRDIATVNRPELRIRVAGAVGSGPRSTSDLFGHMTTGGLRITHRKVVW